MSDRTESAPAWLFSFVDLAFLLLIAMTQIGGSGASAPDLGEIVVPRIRADATDALPRGARERWQLRVHPPRDGEQPFQLVRAGADAPRVTPEALRARLAQLRDSGAEKPLLAPHEESRSRDLLDAVALLEEQWPGRRRASVSAAPGRP